MRHRIKRVPHICLNDKSRLTVIPAKAGIHASYWRWIPAFAGMTIRIFFSDLPAWLLVFFCRKRALHMSMVERHPLLKTSTLVLLVLSLICALGPIYLALCSASVTSQQILLHGLALLPGPHLGENLAAVLHRADVGHMLLNSFIVSLIVVAGKLALASTSAF